MLKEYQLPFKVGQSSEAQSFKNGFRGAWFRCKIQKISCRRGHWNALCQFNSEAIVVADGNWQAGDLVDWWANGCYWSGKLPKIFGSSEAELALTPPPVGEGAIYEVSSKDLHPSLDWSPNFGWAVPTSQDGDSVRRRCAQLFQPVNQAFGRFPALEIQSISEASRDSPARTGSSSDLSFSTHSSANLSPVPYKKRDSKTTEWSDISSGSHTGDESTKESCLSDKSSSSCIGKFRTSDGIRLHSMGSDSTEAAILELEELIDKIKWLRGLLELGKPVPNAAMPSWKFVEHHISSGKK
ncbi:unnamed protein product [Withania somnifera]